ncbi:MAG: MoaD/ThiS family protein [Rhodospirillales bacterium]
MNIRLKLYASLSVHLPADAVKNEAEVQVADGTTVQEALDSRGLPRELCHLVLVNGVFTPPDERRSRVLQNGDHLAVWPPVAGG